MTLSRGHPTGEVHLRYRRADGEFADTTLQRVVVDDLVAGLPVREFRWYRGRRHYSGWYWSSTMGGLVAYESRLELARIVLADYDRNVVAIAAQPFQLIGPEGGRLRRHVPDLLLLSPAGEVTVVDVKTAAKAADPRVRAVFAWTGKLAGWRGWDFEVWSGADPQLLDNIAFLAGYRRQAVIATPLIPAVLAAARTRQSIGAIENALSGQHPPALTRPVVMHLLWTGHLEADLASPLSASAAVRLREEVRGSAKSLKGDAGAGRHGGNERVARARPLW
jgi:hypothetical protein